MFLGVFVLLRLAFYLFYGPARIIENKNAFIVRANYKMHLLRGVMGLSSAWHTDHHSGDTIDRIEKGTNGLFDFAEGSFLIIGQSVILIGSYIAMLFYNIHASYIILLLIIVNVWIIKFYDKKLIPQWRDLNRAENKIAEKIYDVISNITTVIILRIEKLLSKSIMERVMSPLDLYVSSSKRNEAKWFLVSMVNVIGVFLVLGSHIYFSLQSNALILAGTLFILFGYVDRINNVFFEFAYLYGRTVRIKTKVRNSEELTEEFRSKEKIEQINLRKGWSVLEIKNLSFSYHNEEGADLHLDSINFKIKKGEKIALVGESGSGKTTTLKIIRELFSPQTEDVYLDGEKLQDGISSISSNISLIPQDPEIFNTTILENITFGIPYPLALVDKYIGLAQLTDVVTRLPKGLDSSIVEKGVNLSGGEKQRLALSRGLLASKNKEIILLDEPTSSVDSYNELKIFQNIFTEFKDKAVIASIHRLHLLGLFDKILFFENGRVTAQGEFNELLEKSPKFREVWGKYETTKESVTGY
ncbi:MAG: hypothetical protein COU06_02055 [Candidatus Harrisonbacteria bacterium CG10_big_fil_rev_8_21_14_0_10_38_8]|uniref:ABC transporter ATP-binding protein n=1 Tax=Candidatus Harrisonbacteria bacterium CG10_big_fil_rev_8_21_14_0_10_38_8 TaxID=1974582 RepID=A0A2M6WJT2_9BACT|nr:MAG: hypothetical protein COU06_02055 [Candidatus Harrisonbacteria bacterium CG10_big_fil_rev_8_21_14_0_10_38_8]